MRGLSSWKTASATGAPGSKTARAITAPPNHAAFGQWVTSGVPQSTKRWLGFGSPRSMLELPFAREHHGDSVFVGRRDHFVVSERAAWLDDRRDSGRGHGVEAVAEREERVARGRAALGPSRRFLNGELARMHTVLLPAADPDRHPVGDQ